MSVWAQKRSLDLTINFLWHTNLVIFPTRRVSLRCDIALLFSVGGWGSVRRRGSGAGGALPLLLLMSSMGSAGQWRRSLVRVVRINLAAAIIKLQIAVVVTLVVVVVVVGAVVVVAWHLLLLLSPFVCLVSPRLVSPRLVCAEGRSSIGLFGDDE